MKTEKEFRDFFDKKLLVALKPLEDKRIEGIKNKKKARNYSYLIGLFLPITLLLVNYNASFLVLTFITSLVLIFNESIALDKLSKTYKSLKYDYKHKIIPDILGFLYSEFEYIPNQKIAKTVFEKSLLFPSEIRFVEGEDFMRFWIDNADIMFCESKVYGHPPVSMQFSGIFISATFNKFFASRTFVFPEQNTSFWRKIKFKTLGADYYVKLEDPEFEKEFIILGDNQVESRYILTPSLMERILQYKRKLKCEFSLSFVQNRLYCAIPNYKDLFEPRLDESFLNYNFILESYEPIFLYSGLIEDLNLNLRIWTKE